MRKKILICVGTRPNVIKISQFEKCFKQFDNLEYLLLHTGQHYDKNMNDVFFEELEISKPHIQFVLKSKTQVQVIAEIMLKFEETCLSLKPDMVVVPGDVNSTLACALAAQRNDIPVAHIESGLRSFDFSMPEEINRVLVDKLSSIHFVTEESGLQNLKKENFNQDSIKYVGNTMIDTLVSYKNKIDENSILKDKGLESKKYVLLTFHRPGNVDNLTNLSKLVDLIKTIAKTEKVVFPIHPRTLNKLKDFKLYNALIETDNLILTNPLGYFSFLSLIQNAKVVVTDSGGIQEETTFMQVPCITVRPNTERPITIKIGTNVLMDFDVKKIANKIVKNEFLKGEIPKYWDGNSTQRIISEINNYFK